MKKKVTYYLIWEQQIGKREEGGIHSGDYLLKDGRWIPDEEMVVMDHLAGFDKTEREDSQYHLGTTSVLMEIEEIPEEKAIQLINQQILSVLKEKWKEEFKEKKKEWNKAPGWPAKLVETNFILNGIEYSLYPADLGLSDDNWDEGFMESIQYDLKRDLEEYGAKKVYNLGFLD